MKTDMAVASAATLVAAQCVEAAESMGADRDHLMSAISSTDNVRSHGDISTLTAAAAKANSFCRGTPNTRCQCLTLPNKLYSIHSKSLYYSILHPQLTKISAFSVRACGRANKYKILSSDARKRPVAAIDFSGRRVTVRDVASKDNFKSNQTQKALANEVWNGDFHKNLVLSIKTQSLLEKGKMAASYLLRVSFWLSLAASTVVRVGVILLEGIMLGFIGSPRSKTNMDNIQISSKDLCCARIIDWIFSYVFGDGDPNQGIEEKRWKMIQLYIALNGSVVTAEEIAPYLDPKTTGKLVRSIELSLV